jgi:hypothetical protein
MIDVRTVRKMIGGALLALLVLVAVSGPVRAGPGNQQDGRSLGSDSVGQRVRERGRMQAEYQEMREARRVALAEARESVAPIVLEEGEIAPSVGGIRGIAGGSGGSSASVDPAADGKPVGVDQGGGSRFFLLCSTCGLLCTALLIRFRRRGMPSA